LAIGISIYERAIALVLWLKPQCYASEF